MNQQSPTQTMWRKFELYEAMKKEGWEPGADDGKFIHKETGYCVDMMSRDNHGTLWIRYAAARVTPPPF